MNIINIALKEIKEGLRDRYTLSMMILFPIGLLIVLGTALSSVYDDKNISIGKIEISYSISNDNNMIIALEELKESLKKDEITFTKIDKSENAIEKVKSRDVVAHINVDNDKVDIYKNNRYARQADIAEGILRSFLNKYSFFTQVINIDPTNINKALESNDKNYIKETSLNKEKSPGAMDYFAVTLTLLTGTYAATYSVRFFSREKYLNTANRILISPIKKYELFTGKVLGGMAINIICSLIVFFTAKYILKANFGENTFLILLIILTEVMLFVAIGIFIAYVNKKSDVAKMITNLLVHQIFPFLSGAYFMFKAGPGFLRFVTELIPLRWNITGLLSLIYNNDINAALKTIILNILVSLVLIAIGSLIKRKEEGM